MLRPLLLFIIVSAVIIMVWFRQGLVYGGAEVGIPTYNPGRLLEIQRFIWWGAAAPGMLVPHFITGVPFYFLLTPLQTVLSPSNLQAVLFLFLLFLTGFGMYLLTLSIIEEPKKIYACLAGLFYMFNSYMVVEIWHRFLYTASFLAAFLPFILLFWRLWISKGRFLFLVLFLLTNLASSYMFGNLASVLAVWLGLILISLTDVFIPFKGKSELAKMTFRFFAGAFFWVVTNIWWLIPVFGVASGLLPEQHSSEDNINTLINIGRQTILPYTLQFANPFYLFYTMELGQVYTSFFFRLIPWIPALVIFVGLINSLKRKFLAGFALIYLLAIIFSKGPTDPFGYPYIWAFKNIYVVGVIRNPFEKLGILLPIFGSILFVVGLEVILSWARKKFGEINSKFLLGAILLSVLIFAWPMFFGTVIKKPSEPLQVQVPIFYKQANDWLKIQKEKKGNILHLPFSGGDVVTYNWEHGYHGVDVNELLFDSLPSLTRNLGMKRVDDTLSSLTFLFYKSFSEKKDQLLKILQNLDISFIILHKDVRWMDVSTYGKDNKLIDPSQIEDNLNSFDFLEKKATFGDLIIYKVKDIFYKPKIVLFDSANLIYPGESNYLKITTLVGNDEMITPFSDDASEKMQPSKVKNISVFPQNSLEYSMASESAMEALANNMLSDPNRLDSPIIQLKIMENYFHQSGELNSKELVQKIINACENLIKSYNNRTIGLGSSGLHDYHDSIKNIFKNDFKTLSLLKLYRAQIANTFYLHLYLLDKLTKQQSYEQAKILEIRNNLIDGLKENNLLPSLLQSYAISNQEINKKVAQFKIPLKSRYELFMNFPNNLDLYPNFLSNLDIRINDKPVDKKGNINKNIISFGEIDLEKGNYEISYNLFLSPNLVPLLDNFLKAGDIKIIDKDTAYLSSGLQGIAFLENPIKQIFGKDAYKITFDALFEEGNEFYLEIMQDMEDFDSSKEYQKIESNECSKHNCYPVKLNSGKNGWQKFTVSTTPLNLASRKANIRILVFSKIENSRQVPGNIFIKNFQVNRLFNGDIFLVKKGLDNIQSFSPGEVISIIKHSPIFYSGKIKINKPTFLLFKETFHPGWILKLTQDDKVQKINNHFLGNLYANTYFIDKIGEYDFKLEFEPQNGADKGLIISAISWILVLTFLIKSEFLRKS